MTEKGQKRELSVPSVFPNRDKSGNCPSVRKKGQKPVFPLLSLGTDRVTPYGGKCPVPSQGQEGERKAAKAGAAVLPSPYLLT